MLSIPLSFLDALRKWMGIVLTVPMDLEGKMESVKSELRNVCSIAKMVHVNCAILNILWCTVNVDTTFFWAAKWSFQIIGVHSAMLHLNFKTTTVVSNTAKSTTTTVVTLVNVDTTSHKIDHVGNMKKDAWNTTEEYVHSVFLTSN